MRSSSQASEMEIQEDEAVAYFEPLNLVLSLLLSVG